MSDLAQQIGRIVPFLRRYARAVAGSQAAGDDAVKLSLARLLAQPDALAEAALRLVLFRAVERALVAQNPAFGPAVDEAAFGSAAGNDPVEPVSILARRIGELEPIDRRLLLLTRLEGLTAGDAAWVLSMDGAEALSRLARAKEALRAQPPSRVLIIEDEPAIALDIRYIVQRLGHAVCGIATTHSEAVELARTERPGLVLADIQLAADSSGLEAVREILAGIDIPVIFVTAYPERLLTGERPEPTFLVTKPFDEDTLVVAIAHALSAAAAG